MLKINKVAETHVEAKLIVLIPQLRMNCDFVITIVYVPLVTKTFTVEILNAAHSS